jgi:pimeloyl-ACP methyl ester carboxylesterase
MITRPDSAPVLPDIHVPTLIVVGGDDTITPIADAEHMHRGIRGSRLVVIPRAGHMSNMEAPQSFNDALTGCLAGL